MRCPRMFLLASLVISNLPVSIEARQLWDGNATTAVAVSCGTSKQQLDDYVRKDKYFIGIHVEHDQEKHVYNHELIFQEYLTATAGQKFDPPIQFELIPVSLEQIVGSTDTQEVDFFYANPGFFSCVATEVGAIALNTVIRRLIARGRTYDLDVVGGVIAVRYDREDINSLQDLKGKVVAAGSIVDLMGGQMQIHEMGHEGMSFLNDPKQFVFTLNEEDIVSGVLSGRYDVGFIQTGQIEMTKDKNGNNLDPDLFKIIDTKDYILETGELFPFIHSTGIFAEWPFAALPGVPAEVQHAVQHALLQFGDFLDIGGTIRSCVDTEGNNTFCHLDNIRGIIQGDFTMDIPCDATNDLVLMAAEAGVRTPVGGFRIAQSYQELRSIQEEAGLLIQDDNGDLYCTRPSHLHGGIQCPEGYFKRHEIEFNNGCNRAGLFCNQSKSYSCFCNPCVKAGEVDVYQLNVGEEDPHLLEFYGEAYPGCSKMSICAEIRQESNGTLRVYDNRARDDIEIIVEVHAGDKIKILPVRNIPGTYAYEFDVIGDEVQVQVIDIRINGVAIPTSPIRVVVLPRYCEATRAANEAGECECAEGTYKYGSECITSPVIFIVMLLGGIFVVVGGSIYIYLGYKRKQNDLVWHIQAEELDFNDPPDIIGQGAFGVVILGQYRGTKVAVKRVIPHFISGADSKAGLDTSDEMAEQKNTNSTESHNGKPTSSNRRANARELISKCGSADGKPSSLDSRANARQRSTRFRLGNANGDQVIDLEAGNSLSARGQIKASDSMSGSSNDWERLLNMRHVDNDTLSILQSATAFRNGSDTSKGSVSRRQVILRFIPMFMRWDAQSTRIREFHSEMRLISRLRHPCITTVMGAVVSRTVDPMLVLEFMEYGSLYDLLRNETMTAGGEIILQIVRDIVQGIQFLHASKPAILHGDLKAKNILVDSRFRAKVADFGFAHVKTQKASDPLRGTPFYLAPEYLRRRSEYTTQCDIYSLGMIMYEIYARQAPFEGEDPQKILPKICHPRQNKRPSIPEACPPKMVELMKKCWHANEFVRPQAKEMDYVLLEMTSKDAEPLKTKEELARECARRKPTSLFDVFPKKVAEALNAGMKVEAETHDMVSIFFSDIVGFTTITQSQPAMKVSNMLDRLYTAFDNLPRKHKVFKVETIGDAWMGVTNLDHDEFESHARQIAEFAEDAIRAASNIAVDEDDLSLGYITIRVGLHSGPVVSNVIGSLNPRFGLFGDTVNTASRMESNSLPGRIHCSFATAEILKVQAPDIRLELRGMVDVKGKGKMKTFWVGPENLGLMHPSAISVQAMGPLPERDDEDNTDSYHDHSELDDTLELRDCVFSKDTADANTGTSKPWMNPPQSSSMEKTPVSVHTTGTDSLSDSVSSSDGFPSGETQQPPRSAPFKSQLSGRHPTVKIGMDGKIEAILQQSPPIQQDGESTVW